MNQAEDKKLLVEAVAKGVVCVLFVVMLGYSVFTEVKVQPEVLSLIATFLAVYFGVSARSTLRARSKS